MVNRAYVLIYKNRFLILYITFGFLSLLVENFVRIFLNNFFNLNIANIAAIFVGIILAYYLNVKFNFKVPVQRLRISMVYFFLVSIFSITIQFFFGNLTDLSFIQNRYLISAIFFIVAYLLHRRFTFKDYKKIGVAIHLNNDNDISKIYDLVKDYPDFIHLDLIDESYNPDNISCDVEKIAEAKNVWPTKKIQLHIMSNNPIYWIEKTKHLGLEIFFHFESLQESIDILKKYENISIGIVINEKTSVESVQNIIKFFDKLMILCISTPGLSGQKYSKEVDAVIEQVLNNSSNKKLKITLDGGLTPEIVSKFNVNEVVSSSAVFLSENPVLKLTDFQTANKYKVKK